MLFQSNDSLLSGNIANLQNQIDVISAQAVRQQVESELLDLEARINDQALIYNQARNQLTTAEENLQQAREQYNSGTPEDALRLLPFVNAYMTAKTTAIDAFLQYAELRAELNLRVESYNIPANAASNNQFFIWKLFGKLFYFF